MKITKLSVCVSMVGLLATLPAAYANEIVTNCTQVTAAGAEDLDSTPNNMVGSTVVEDDESCVKVMIPFDYGDAPDPSYQTMDASGGARHQLGTDVFLGQCVDGDSGALQGAATADDEDAGSPTYGNCTTPDDEDGVTFGELRVAETGSTVEVVASKECKLNAWIDWNIDGSWGGAAEQVFLNQQLTAGTNTLSLDVPAFALAGDTYARFRCSTVGNDGIGGEAADGEVEDYKVTVLEAIPAKPVSVGNYLWVDENQNGQQDEGEPAMVGAVVTLTDPAGNPVKDLNGNLVQAQTTGSDGLYLFGNLPEGDYIVKVTPPEGYQVTLGGADPDVDQSITDSNCSVVDGNIQTPVISLLAGSQPDTVIDGDGVDGNLTVDCGFYKPKAPTHSIGNMVWIDDGAGTSANANNGVVDAGEGMVADGVTVELRDKAGALLSSTTTSNGYYLFSGLEAGEYSVCVAAGNFNAGSLLAGYTASMGGDELDPNSDKDNNDNGDNTVEDGLCATAIVLDDQEPTSETPTASGTAGDDGMGTEDNRSNLTIDFGVVPPAPASISGTVNVLDGDAVITPAGVVISLLNTDGSPVLDSENKPVTTTTDGNGAYLFENVPPGDYLVEETDPAGVISKSDGDSTQPEDDASNDDTNDNRIPVSVVAGEADSGNDFVDEYPVAKTVSVGDYIWIDANENGQQDAGEQPLEGAVVTLLHADGTAVMQGGSALSVSVGADGKYLFSNLPEGDYIVRVEPPAGYSVTSGGVDVDFNTSNTDNNCSVVGANIQTQPFTLQAGTEPDTGVDGNDTDSNLTVDCGFYVPKVPTHSIGNMVWVDDGAGTETNANNGTFDSGESMVADGVIVELRDNKGTLISSATTDKGYYLFSGLAVGEYQVCVAASNFNDGELLAGYTASTGGDEADANANGDNNDNGDNTTADGLCSNVIVLDDQEPDGEMPTATGTAGDDGMGTDDNRSNLTVDFGVIPPKVVEKIVSVGDYIWIDENENGQQDAGELPLEGAVVSLHNADGSAVVQNGVALSVSIGADGHYLFDNLPEGDYIVRVQPPEGYQVTAGGADVDVDASNTDSNCKVVGGNIQTMAFTLTAGTEPDTAADGNDADSNLTVDCGFYKPKVEPGATVAVGNRIWLDTNGNGLQDEGENGLQGAVVTLTDASGRVVTDADGSVVNPQTTGSDGLYAFSKLLEGDYIVTVEPPQGYFLTTGGIDVDDDMSDKDSNCRANALNGTIDTHPFTLTAGMEPDSAADGDDANGNMTVDCGFYGAVSVGDRIWLDTNANGQQDSDEPGISGVTVSLVEEDGVTPATDINGSQVAAVTTDANGNYLFDNLMPGNYIVVVNPGKDSGYSLTQGGADPDEDASNTDSNCKVVGDVFQTPAVTLAAGTEPDAGVDGDDTSSNRTVDCGLFRAVNLGSRIWIDLDGNGKQDGGEPGVPGALVTLLTAEGNPVTDVFGNPIEPQTTDADGNYFFSDLREGSYVVKVTPPPGYLPTVVVADPNNNDGTDSNGMATEDGSVISQPIDLKWGEEPTDGGATNTTLGFGFVPNLQIPTLSQWGMAILSMLLATAAFFRRRRED